LPPDGAPAERKKMIPIRVSDAPRISRRPIRWWVSQIPRGRAMTRLRAVSDCTTTRAALSRATAWTTHPVAWQIAPISQIGLCRICRRKLGSPSPAVVSMVPFCWSTVPKANRKAATTARNSPISRSYPEWWRAGIACASMARSTLLGAGQRSLVG